MIGKKTLAAALTLCGLSVATPAHADIFTYTMTNGSVLTIDNQNNSGTFVGTNIDVTMTSDDFAGFTGGAKPNFTSVLSSLDGTRLVKGNWITDNPYLADSTHPQMLKMFSSGKVNLWAWWGDPIIAGDYITNVASYSVTKVPEPGMLGLFGLAAAGIAFGRRRKKGKAERRPALAMA